jgi:L-alanine-DL-glutamate epimerase-like enolase superfamily enzyme
MQLKATLEFWPLKRPFVISRMTQTQAVSLHVSLEHDGLVGTGESEPHETDHDIQHAVTAQVRAIADQIHIDIGIEELRELLPAPTARNAVDCALWSLRAKRRGIAVWQLAGLAQPGALATAMTIGLASAAEMGERAREMRDCEVIKIKLDGGSSIERVEAVRRNAPGARLTVDVNEAWSIGQLREYSPQLARLGVAMIEQPLPACADAELEHFRGPVPLCADESCVDASSLPLVAKRYQMANVKLDKTGGFSEALLLAREARRRGLGLMTGCNVGTSLAMAPAFLLGTLSDFVDIDGASMLTRDREPGIRYDLARGRVQPPDANVWG